MTGTGANPIDAKPSNPRFWGRLRAYFLTGLVVSAPIGITIWLTLWFVGLFDVWIKPLIPYPYNPDHYLPFSVPGVGLVCALVGITLIGALAANLVGRRVIFYWDALLNRTPIVRSVYKGIKQIFETVFSQTGTTFRQVGLIEWPRKGIYSIVFVSREIDGGQVGLEPGRPMYAVYISTTPNPTSGYVYFVDVADVRILDMPVEDALKLIISMGLVFPEREGGFHTIGPKIDASIAKTLLGEKKKPKRTTRRKPERSSAAPADSSP
jgi:uncharacterized membrane protein